MKIRKIMAAVLAASMVLGNGIVGFAGDVSGQGTVSYITNKDTAAEVVLPTQLNSGGVLDFTVDPQGLIAESGFMFTADSDGSAFAASPTGSDGVYFVNSGGSFKSTSDEVKLIVHAQKDQDVFVTAATSGGTIEMVDSSGALDSSGVAKLYLEVKLGSGGTAKAITDSAGVTVNAKVDGKPNNYKTKTKSGGTIGQYEIGISDGVTEADWGYAALTLSGKSKGIVPATGLKAPSIEFTWRISQHYTEKDGYGNWGDAFNFAIDEETGFPKDGITSVSVSEDGAEYLPMDAGKYTVYDNGWISATWDDMVEVLDTEESEHLYVGVVVGDIRYVIKAY